jgi:[acyl-carrier-protein] S-malonyltransferase
MIAVVFPGQGSQSVGMGREFIEAFPRAREVIEETDEALKIKLSKIILEGPESDLTLTENTQPALLATSMMMSKVLEQQVNQSLENIFSWTAGHSLGEYTALCAAQAFSFHEALKLVKLRGKAMQEAVPLGLGAMAAVLGLDHAIIEETINSISGKEYVGIANDNSPGQIVISGHKNAVNRACEILLEKGAKRCVDLPVSAPFHSILMQPAADIMSDALNQTNMQPCSMNVMMNVTAAPLSHTSQIPDLLVKQITGQVRWRESILAMVKLGCSTFVEIGAGKVLTGLIKRIAPPEVQILNIATPHDLDEVLKKII